MSHTVLVVDDEEDLRETIRDALELNGYTVIAARNGKDALEQIEHVEDLCLVLLDLFMPELDGWGFYERFRERPNRSNVPVIVHSSATDRAPQGVTRVLRKPVGFETLLSVVHEFCSG